MEALRKEEEELMEKRRQELLGDPTGYWRQRMAEQLAAEALLQGEDGTSTGEVRAPIPLLTLPAATALAGSSCAATRPAATSPTQEARRCSCLVVLSLAWSSSPRRPPTS
jgi:hypothetical protein